VATNHRDVAEAFRVTLDLFETGVALMRQNLRRQDSSATEEDIDQRLAAWLHHRPGAELGDAVGQPPARPRWSWHISSPRFEPFPRTSPSAARRSLVGGLAVSVRTEPRFTRDADLAVALSDDAAAEDLINPLREYGYSIAAVLEQAAGGRLATVRLERPGAGQAPIVDLLFASSGIEGEIVSAAEEIEILPGFSIRVARTGHLIALKLLSRDDVERPQDIADLRALLRSAAPEELALAGDSIVLIMRRGFNRSRSLSTDLAALLAPKLWGPTIAHNGGARAAVSVARFLSRLFGCATSRVLCQLRERLQIDGIGPRSWMPYQ
jgi:hypothetical protein